MKKMILLIAFCCFSFKMTKAQSLYFPPLTGNQWDSTSLSSLGWCQDKLDTLLNYLDDRNTKAFIVLKDGKIVVEKYFNTFTMDSLWYWASAGKTLTGFTTGLAQQDGFLSINDTTSNYLGQGWTVAPSAKENLITIKNQLSMTSGLNDGVPDHHCTIDTCLEYLADAGTRWAYHNGPYTLLDSVIESATGQTLNQYFAQKVKIPTGITGTFVKIDFNNVFVSKARSMARFGLLMLNKGKWNSTPIMTDTSFFHDMTNTSQAINESYGYLWWLNGKSTYMLPSTQFVFNGPLNPNAPADMIAALGKNGQFLNVVPSQNLVWIRMGDAPNSNQVPYTLNDSIWQKLNQVMCTPNRIDEPKLALSNFLISPNPAMDVVHIQTSASDYSIQINDMTGRMVYYMNNYSGHLNINIENLHEGFYTISFKQKGRTVSAQKLIIRR